MCIRDRSYTTSHAELSKAEVEIEEGRKEYAALNMDKAQAKDDEDLLKDIERIEKSAMETEEKAAGKPADSAQHNDCLLYTSRCV